MSWSRKPHSVLCVPEGAETLPAEQTNPHTIRQGSPLTTEPHLSSLTVSADDSTAQERLCDAVSCQARGVLHASLVSGLFRHISIQQIRIHPATGMGVRFVPERWRPVAGLWERLAHFGASQRGTGRCGTEVAGPQQAQPLFSVPLYEPPKPLQVSF